MRYSQPSIPGRGTGGVKVKTISAIIKSEKKKRRNPGRSEQHKKNRGCRGGERKTILAQSNSIDNNIK